MAVDVLQLKVVRVHSNLRLGLNAELTLYEGGSTSPTVDIMGAVFDRAAMRTDGGVGFDVSDATSLRALRQPVCAASVLSHHHSRDF